MQRRDVSFAAGIHGATRWRGGRWGLGTASQRSNWPRCRGHRRGGVNTGVQEGLKLCHRIAPHMRDHLAGVTDCAAPGCVDAQQAGAIFHRQPVVVLHRGDKLLGRIDMMRDGKRPHGRMAQGRAVERDLKGARFLSFDVA